MVAENEKEYVRNRTNVRPVDPEDLLKNNFLRTNSAMRSCSDEEGMTYTTSTGEIYRMPCLEDLMDCSAQQMYVPTAGLGLGTRNINWSSMQMFASEFKKEFRVYPVTGDGGCLFRYAFNSHSSF